MPYVTNPSAPPREAAEQAAERMAKALRQEMPEYQVRVVENIHSQFHVIVVVPFRVEHPTWEEREEKVDA